MNEAFSYKNNLLEIAGQFQKKYELSKTVGDDYYNPGMMENLDQYRGEFCPETNILKIRTESKGLRYENRTQRLESLSVGDQVKIVRDPENEFNTNNFRILSVKDEDLGNLSADLCNALAYLYDYGYAVITSSAITYIESIFQRSRYAKQGIMFIELEIQFRGI